MVSTSIDWRLVVQIKRAARGRAECRLYTDIPIPHPIQICVLQDRTDRTTADQIFNALAARLAPFTGFRGDCPAYVPRRYIGSECMARSEPACRSVLVPVTGTGPIGPDLDDEITLWPRHGSGLDIVLPVLPNGASASSVLGAHSHYSALTFNGDADLIADEILHEAGFAGAARRLFISYRRRDCRDVADQLFDRLNREGFEVFLDRFSGTPGRLFPEELAEEIIDKGVLVLLETSGIVSSPWTLAEIAFAAAFGMGRIAINLEPTYLARSIGGNDRHYVTIPPRSTELSPTDLDGAVNFIRGRYAAQILRRRLYLEALLQHGMALSHVPVTKMGGVQFEVGDPSIQAYQVALADRAPEVADVQRAADAAHNFGGKGVVLGPHEVLGPQRRRTYDWLVDAVGVAPGAETKIVQLGRDIKAGLL